MLMSTPPGYASKTSNYINGNSKNNVALFTCTPKEKNLKLKREDISKVAQAFYQNPTIVSQNSHIKSNILLQTPSYNMEGILSKNLFQISSPGLFNNSNESIQNQQESNQMGFLKPHSQSIFASQNSQLSIPQNLAFTIVKNNDYLSKLQQSPIVIDSVLKSKINFCLEQPKYDFESPSEMLKFSNKTKSTFSCMQNTSATNLNSTFKQLDSDNYHENMEVPSTFLVTTPNQKGLCLTADYIIGQYYANSGAKLSVSPF